MNTTEFLENLSRAVTVPTYQPRFTKEDQLALAYDEQKTKVVPMLLGVGQNYLLFREEQTVLAGTRELPFPYRAIARGTKQVYYQGANDDTPLELTRFELSQAAAWRESDNGRPSCFVLFGDNVRLYPKPNTNDLIVFCYYIKPSKPVLESRTAVVTAVGVDTLTVKSIPSNIKIGSVCDMTKARPGFTLTYLDKTVTNISGNTLTFAGFDVSNPITGVSVGDSLSLALETSILQYPEEAADCLVQATAVRILQTLSVPDQLKLASDEYHMKVNAVREIMAPRVEDQPTIIMHGHPLLGFGFRTYPKVNVSDK